MKLEGYKEYIEGLAKMNNPPVSQCIALLRQLYCRAGDIKGENVRLRKKEGKVVVCGRCGKKYYTLKLFDCPFCEEGE